MNRPVDVAIVGGGAIGSAIACFLAADPGFGGRISVIERDPTYRRASSALSAASIRQQFSTPENIRMSRFSFDWLRQADRHLALPEAVGASSDAVDIGLHEAGYLYLATATSALLLQANHETQVAEGADVTLLGPSQLAARFPWLAVDGIALGSLGLAGEGWFDGYALLTGLRRKARSLGVEYVADAVIGLGVERSRIRSVALAEGGTVACDVVVDAAGPWAREVARFGGVDLPVEARRRCVFVFESSLAVSGCPLVIDPSGAWFRPDGSAFIGAIAPAESDDLADLPLEVDRRLFEDRLWPALAGRVPAFDAVRVTNAWAGYYEVNTVDHNAIIGPHPEITNLLFANGFSGHGIQHAPAVGRAISELVVHGRYVSLDLSVFAYERLAAGRRVVERNIIG
ncbi:MAG TPA: FAD-binding oxidoreductase [Candidatus Limnocylindrales bacterium]|nr:FAD-binding oxidoreductase [Candidatus Limnocylindrales bacterium]